MTMRILLLLMTILFLASCRREDPNPELSDRIYQDLQREVVDIGGLIDAATKKKEEATKDLAKSGVRTMERKNAQIEIRKQDMIIQKLSELKEYYEIRAKMRLHEGRRLYRIAFQEGKVWPDPKEYEAYLVNKRLRAASRNWNDRVPKIGQSNELASVVPGENAESGSGESQ